MGPGKNPVLIKWDPRWDAPMIEATCTSCGRREVRRATNWTHNVKTNKLSATMTCYPIGMYQPPCFRVFDIVLHDVDKLLKKAEPLPETRHLPTKHSRIIDEMLNESTSFRSHSDEFRARSKPDSETDSETDTTLGEQRGSHIPPTQLPPGHYTVEATRALVDEFGELIGVEYWVAGRWIRDLTPHAKFLGNILKEEGNNG